MDYKISHSASEMGLVNIGLEVIMLVFLPWSDPVRLALQQFLLCRKVLQHLVFSKVLENKYQLKKKVLQ